MAATARGAHPDPGGRPVVCGGCLVVAARWLRPQACGLGLFLLPLCPTTCVLAYWSLSRAADRSVAIRRTGSPHLLPRILLLRDRFRDPWSLYHTTTPPALLSSGGRILLKTPGQDSDPYTPQHQPTWQDPKPLGRSGCLSWTRALHTPITR